MPKTLLLADASQTTRRIVDLALAGQDVRVVAVDDGLRAAELVEQEPPDLVLADVGLPGCSGYELAQVLRVRPDLRHIPVLLLAGVLDGVDPGQAHRVGADGILTKPLDTAVFVGRVTELLAHGRPGTASVHAPAPLRTGWAVGPTADEVPALEPQSEEVDDEALDAATAEAAPHPADVVAAADNTHAAPEMAPVAAADATAATAPATADYFSQIDEQFAALARAPRPPMPTSEEPEFDEVDDEAPLQVPQAPAPGVHAPASPVALTDAFAALLDAERGGGTPPPVAAPRLVAPAPVAPDTPAAAPAIDLDRLADQIAARVLAQLSDRVVRDTVRDMVADTTERLVREEIERIKQHIK